MRRILATIFSLVFMLSLVSPALATSDNNPPGSQNDNANTNSNSNDPQGGAGGQGGGGGQGGNGQGGQGGGGGNANNSPVTTITNTANGGAGGAGGAANAASSAKAKANATSNATGIGVGTGGSSKAKATGGAATANAPTSIAGDKVEVYASAPAVYAPALTSSPEACMGSTSMGGSGGNGIMGFGLSFGNTWKSEDCELRMFARSLQALGEPVAALTLLAQNNPKVLAALLAAGVKIKLAASVADVRAAEAIIAQIAATTAPGPEAPKAPARLETTQGP